MVQRVHRKPRNPAEGHLSQHKDIWRSGCPGIHPRLQGACWQQLLYILWIYTVVFPSSDVLKNTSSGSHPSSITLVQTTFYIQTQIRDIIFSYSTLTISHWKPDKRSKLIISPVLAFLFPQGVSAWCFLEHNDLSWASTPWLTEGGCRLNVEEKSRGKTEKQRRISD